MRVCQRYSYHIINCLQFCDLLLKRPTATWKLFVLCNKEVKKLIVMSFVHLSTDQNDTEFSLLCKT